MRNKMLLILMLMMSIQLTGYSQIRLHLKKKVENQANNRANKNADDLINKGFNKVENGIKGLFKKKNKKNKSTTTTERTENPTASDEKDSNTGSTASADDEQTKAPQVKWAKYDFVPGDQVIFEDGPSADEENGEFPSRWDLDKGGAEIAEMNGVPVIMFLSHGSSIVPYLKNPKEDHLPEIFTLEMDVWFGKSYTTANRLWIYLGDNKNNHASAGSNTDLTVMPHGLEFLDSEKSYPGTENIGWSVEKQNVWHHIAIAYTKGKFKAYMNDTRLINIPHLSVNPTGITLKSGKSGIYVKNIRIAKGGVKYYDRMLSDGKIIVNGIRFDINKATIKPESMGAINKIYQLMVKYPDLKFSVEGHTDADGDAASNQELSEARGKSVMDKLIAMGIASERLKSTGWGESKPLDTNATAEGKANNRRVEFVKF